MLFWSVWPIRSKVVKKIWYYLKYNDGITNKIYELIFFKLNPIDELNVAHSKEREVKYVNVNNSKNSSEVNIGKYDQFQIMYQDLIDNNFLKFEYSNHENLLKRYNLMREVLKEIN